MSNSFTLLACALCMCLGCRSVKHYSISADSTNESKPKVKKHGNCGTYYDYRVYSLFGDQCDLLKQDITSEPMIAIINHVTELRPDFEIKDSWITRYEYKTVINIYMHFHSTVEFSFYHDECNVIYHHTGCGKF